MMKKLLKKLSLVAILSLAFATLQAQTPIVHLKLDNNLNDDGSLGLTFEVGGANSAGVIVPYSTGSITSLIAGVGSVDGNVEGSHAINFSVIGDDTDVSYNLIQNGGGFDAEIQSTTNLGITGNDARTISAWFRYDDRLNTTNGTHVIVNIGDPVAGATFARNTLQHAGANNRIQFGIGGANVQWFYDPDDTNATNYSTIEDGNWHHVAVTYGGGTEVISDVLMYFDGQLVTTDQGGTAGVNPMTTIDDVVTVGSRGLNSQKWFDGGGIDDLRIFNVQLTATEVLALYNENALSTADLAFGENELKAFPNAVVDFLQIQTTSNNALEINVYDLTGKAIIKTSGNSVDMRALSSGMYIVKVREDNKVANLKILKK